MSKVVEMIKLGKKKEGLFAPEPKYRVSRPRLHNIYNNVGPHNTKYTGGCSVVNPDPWSGAMLIRIHTCKFWIK